MKAQKQIGALCVRQTQLGKLRVLLVTSRSSGRWIIPKGWTEKRLPDCEAAAREAVEEAGVTGRISKRPLGRYRYQRVGKGQKQKLRVTVYMLRVHKIQRSWPEQNQRRRAWFSVEGAAARIAEPELRDIIRSLRQRPGSTIRNSQVSGEQSGFGLAAR